jgi:eukaryotic-like serine/threonine-protein kinase
MIYGQPMVARAAMADDPRIEALVEELLNSGAGAEEICRDCPELLPIVQTEWQRVREIQTELGVLFPDPAGPDDAIPAAASASQFPKIADHQVLEVLGHGGMGIVYKAWHLRLHRPVAVKMLLAGPFARPQELERFVREAQAAAGLNHPNIVQIYEVGNAEGRPYFTMEFVEGGSLAQKLAGVPQPVRQAAILTATLAETVQVAHQHGIIHRDLKPWRKRQR